MPVAKRNRVLDGVSYFFTIITIISERAQTDAGHSGAITKDFCWNAFRINAFGITDKRG